ncbi:MAG: HD domain-containing protein [Lachnospiraceae bacterium]|nr:HD domain-containing protein [Lachnospiraceae bacterium]
MFQLIRQHQLDIMLALSAACVTMALMLLITQFLSKKRKWILIAMELTATFLLYFDRLAYIFSGNLSKTGYVMVRVSNFFVFFLTATVVFVYNIYVRDLLYDRAGLTDSPVRLKIVSVACIVEMFMVILSQFTGFYYTFDFYNKYHRGPGFLICYVVPVACPLIVYTVIIQYRKSFSKFIFTALTLYTFVPIVIGVIQIYAYGISIVNMAMVVVSISLYFFTYLDINAAVMEAHRMEMLRLQEEKKSIKRLFDQTATAFVKAVEIKDEYGKGHSLRVANVAKQIAKQAGKPEDECDEVYYSALLHDVGNIGLPDSLVNRKSNLSDSEKELLKEKPVIGGDILSSITEYPFLKEGARYSYERFDGKGYPEGLSGENIPDVARIISVADAYDSMSTTKKNRSALPLQTIREEFINNAGSRFDPNYSNIMLDLIDSNINVKDHKEVEKLETEIKCDAYRSSVTVGIPIVENITKITFDCELNKDGSDFSAPSIIIFDAYDNRVHTDSKAIDAYRYCEYGELWFDGHFVSTGVKNEDISVGERDDGEAENDGRCKILSVRYEDHVLIKMYNGKTMVSAILSIGDKSRSAYIALTGENCSLKNISEEFTLTGINMDECRRISDEVSYIERMESDVPNVQVDRPQSAYSDGMPVTDGIAIDFHTMSLPTASLVWHCPYVLLFSSDDGKVGGPNYRDYVLIKLNGEASPTDDDVENRFEMKKTSNFEGWDVWKRINKEGFECEVEFARKGNKVIVRSDTLGIFLEDELTLKDPKQEIYAAITGDQVALTDIRVH